MPTNQNYVLGRGRLFFAQYDNNALPAAPDMRGMRYMGATSAFTLTSEGESIDHYSMEGGMRVKDDSVQTEHNLTGTITSDDISAENLAIWFGGESLAETQASAPSLTSNITGARRGYVYQVGVSASNPEGDMNLSSLSVTKGGVAVAPAGNYNVDLKNGLLEILPTATGIADNDNLVVTYALAAGARTVVVDKGSIIYGALRFVADNARGVNRHAVLPYVKLQSTGDLALKTEEYMSMSFSVEALQLNANTRRIYLPTA